MTVIKMADIAFAFPVASAEMHAMMSFPETFGTSLAEAFSMPLAKTFATALSEAPTITLAETSTAASSKMPFCVSRQSGGYSSGKQHCGCVFFHRVLLPNISCGKDFRFLSLDT
ncbi:hypothetical protein GALL_42800 [mine drainage metagenome]|uniref:Uncharacterized protein n=1 Tax=mine drainage metagenome TaxID=410659 RepID=A0A1J5T126_9ZZZZ